MYIWRYPHLAFALVIPSNGPSSLAFLVHLEFFQNCTPLRESHPLLEKYNHGLIGRLVNRMVDFLGRLIARVIDSLVSEMVD